MAARPASVMTGGCQCGAVRYALYTAPTHASICHCRMCQKASGNYFQPFTGVPRAEFTWTKGTPGTFRSSELVERDFCRDCGTPLTYRALDRDRVSVTIGSLDEPGRIALEMQYGVESAVLDLGAAAQLTTITTEASMPAERLAQVATRQHPDHD
ncbi:MAG TPA: GFA family protein [Hyphomicrobiaceae bacterium]|nr:GFA family protein [Hyphomicrobiaceae bacterium]